MLMSICAIINRIVLKGRLNMDYQGFTTWLLTKKCMSQRSAKDVVSRLKRVMNMAGADHISEETMLQLNQSVGFQTCSMFIKSQLRRSVVLYNEFQA
jgi:hypothetical protein